MPFSRKPAVGGELERADAEGRTVDVHDTPAHLDEALDRVEIRVRNRPAVRARDRQRRPRASRRHRPPTGPVWLCRATTLLRPSRMRVSTSTCASAAPWFDTSVWTLDVGLPVADGGRRHKRAPVRDVDRIGEREPDVPVDAGAGVPPRRRLLDEDAHREHVRLVAELQERRQLVLETSSTRTAGGPGSGR